MRFISIFAALLIPATVFAHDYSIGDLVVMHPVAFETPVTAQTGAGYLVITNNGDKPDRLIAIEASFPRVMMHDTIVESDISKMVHLDGVDIAAGETVTFAPGGKHVMFMGLNGDPFETGEKITATLVFETAGRLEVVFNVEERADIHNADADDDKNMDHGDMGDAHMDHTSH